MSPYVTSLTKINPLFLNAKFISIISPRENNLAKNAFEADPAKLRSWYHNFMVFNQNCFFATDMSTRRSEVFKAGSLC